MAEDRDGSFRQSLRALARDLLAIEVNTIVKSRITARKMPPMPHAVLDVIAEYYWFIVEVNAKVGDEAVEDTLAPLGPTTRTNGAESCERLRLAAEALLNRLAEHPDILSEEDMRAVCGILERVRRNASELAKIVEGLEAAHRHLDLWDKRREELIEQHAEMRRLIVDPADVAAVRKMWEVGTEIVTVQSVVQLDGDIITRIREDKTGPDDGELYGMHLQATRLAIETWETMAQLIAALATSLLDVLTKLLRGR